MNEESFLLETLEKCPTGIPGLDEITGGGLPAGRPTLVCGNAGCGKTLLGVEFLVRGITEYDEPGVFMSFEESSEELTRNVSSLGFNLKALVAAGKLALRHVVIERSEIEEAGEYDLEGLFIRLGHAIDSVGAKRVVLDTLEVLFSGLNNQAILRSELRRLFRWLKTKGVTAIITGERGSDAALTRYGLEEYVSDCVIALEHRTVDHISTRHLRVVKYRGSSHGTNEYPFLIDADGISTLPITSTTLDYLVSHERISTGLASLDEMLGGKGFYRGSVVLVSGTAGSGKSSLAATFAHSASLRGERCLYLSFEETTSQITRDMASIGLDLQPQIDQKLLRFHPVRTTLYGLEMHLVNIHKLVETFQPHVVILDPVTAFINGTNKLDVNSMLNRLIDFLKTRQITTFLTSLTEDGGYLEKSSVDISSIIDIWLLLRDIEVNGERNRVINVLKSRGIANSNQVREFLLTDKGIELKKVYTGQSGAFTGSARLAQETRERAAEQEIKQAQARLLLDLETKRKLMESRVAIIRTEFEVEEAAALARLDQANFREIQRNEEKTGMLVSRGAGDSSTKAADTRET